MVSYQGEPIQLLIQLLIELLFHYWLRDTVVTPPCCDGHVCTTMPHADTLIYRDHNGSDLSPHERQVSQCVKSRTLSNNTTPGRI